MRKLKRIKRIKTKKETAKLMHHYYARTGFYLFVWKNLKKAFLPIAGIVLAIFLFNKYVYNINQGLHHFTETFSRKSFCKMMESLIYIIHIFVK